MQTTGNHPTRPSIPSTSSILMCIRTSAQLPPDLHALVQQYGWTAVRENGILPWATVWALDSLIAQARRGDWTKAYQSAADIGHYVGDTFQPLHCTENYDGAMTGNSGIHSRYESSMISTYKAALVVTPGQVGAGQRSVPVHSELHYPFERACRFHPACGHTGEAGQCGELLLDVLRESVGEHGHDDHPARAGCARSCWRRSGSMRGSRQVCLSRRPWMWRATIPGEMTLMPNYPNPFNSTTTIPFSVRETGRVRLTVHTMLGQEIGVLYDDVAVAGRSIGCGSKRTGWHRGSICAGSGRDAGTAGAAALSDTLTPPGEGRRRRCCVTVRDAVRNGAPK